MDESRKQQLQRIQATSSTLSDLTVDELDQQLRLPFESSTSQCAAIFSESAEYRAAISSIRFEKPAIWKNYTHSFDQNEITSLYVAFQYTSSFSLLKFLAFLCSCVDHSTKPLELTLAVNVAPKHKSNPDRGHDVSGAIDRATASLIGLLGRRERLNLMLKAHGEDAAMKNEDMDAMVTALTMFMLRRNREVDTFAFHRPVKSWIRSFREACKANPVQQWQPTLHLRAVAKVVLSMLAATPAGLTLRSLSLYIIKAWSDGDEFRRCLRKLLKAGYGSGPSVAIIAPDAVMPACVLPSIAFDHIELRCHMPLTAGLEVACLEAPCLDLSPSAQVMHINPSSEGSQLATRLALQQLMGGHATPNEAIQSLAVHCPVFDVTRTPLNWHNLVQWLPNLVEVKLMTATGCYGGALCSSREFEFGHYASLLVGKQQVAALAMVSSHAQVDLPGVLLKLLRAVLLIERADCYDDF
jgi:hypothetical protein